MIPRVSNLTFWDTNGGALWSKIIKILYLMKPFRFKFRHRKCIHELSSNESVAWMRIFSGEEKLLFCL